MQLSRPLGWTNCCATIAALFWWYRTPRRDPPTSHHWSPSFSHFQVEHRIFILHSRFRPSSLPPFFYHLVMVVLINEHGLHFFLRLLSLLVIVLFLLHCIIPYPHHAHYPSELTPPSPPFPPSTLLTPLVYIFLQSRTTTVAYY